MHVVGTFKMSNINQQKQRKSGGKQVKSPLAAKVVKVGSGSTEPRSQKGDKLNSKQLVNESKLGACMERAIADAEHLGVDMAEVVERAEEVGEKTIVLGDGSEKKPWLPGQVACHLRIATGEQLSAETHKKLAAEIKKITDRNTSKVKQPTVGCSWKNEFGSSYGPGVMPQTFTDVDGKNWGFLPFVNAPSKTPTACPEINSLCGKKQNDGKTYIWLNNVGMSEGIFTAKEEEDGKVEYIPLPEDMIDASQWNVGDVTLDAERMVDYTKQALFVFLCLLTIGFFVYFNFSLIVQYQVYLYGEPASGKFEHEYEALLVASEHGTRMINFVKYNRNGVWSDVPCGHDWGEQFMKKVVNDVIIKELQEAYDRNRLKYSECVHHNNKLGISTDIIGAICGGYRKLYEGYSKDIYTRYVKIDFPGEECDVWHLSEEVDIASIVRTAHYEVSNHVYFDLACCLLVLCAISYFYCPLELSWVWMEATMQEFRKPTTMKNVDIKIIKFIRPKHGSRHVSHASGDVKSRQVLALVRVKTYFNYKHYTTLFFDYLRDLYFRTDRRILRVKTVSREKYVVDLGLISQLLDPRVLIPGMTREQQKLRISAKASSMTTHQTYSNQSLEMKDMFTRTVSLAQQLARPSAGNVHMDF